MAKLTQAITKDFLDDILPSYGTPARQLRPVWDSSQKMFIFDEHESQNGNHYFRGIRFCDRIAIVEKVGMFHSWTYLDGLEVYAFNGRKMQLIQKRDYPDKVFHNAEKIRKDTEEMVTDFLKGMLKASRISLSEEKVKEQAKGLVDLCYRDFNNGDYPPRLMQIIPAIEQH